MKGSGILKNNKFNSLKEAFEHFFSNSRISILSKSSGNGIILKLNLRENIESSFDDITLGSKFNTPIKSLILKCVFIASSHKTITINNIEKRSMTNEEFKKEVITQVDIYNQSIMDKDFILEPICPAVVNIYKKIPKSLKDSMIQNIEDTLENKDFIVKFLNKQVDINIIAMEFIEGFDTLFGLCHTDTPLYEKFALFELARLHKYGYIHGDYHKENVLINTTYSYYGNAIKGRALILDFGRTEKRTRNEPLHLKTILEDEFNSYGKDGKCYWSYIWLSYYYYNCLDITWDFINHLYVLRIPVNKKTIETVIQNDKQVNTLDKLQKYLKIELNDVYFSLKSPSKTSWGGRQMPIAQKWK